MPAKSICVATEMAGMAHSEHNALSSLSLRVDQKLARKTIKSSLHFSGVALGHGGNTYVTLRPGRNRIAWFLDDQALGPAQFECRRNTTCAVFHGGTVISYVEHLMAALALKGITDLEVNVVGAPELPILDGSAAPFFQASEVQPLPELAGLVPLLIGQPLFVKNSINDAWAVALPSDRLKIRILTQFELPLGKADISSVSITAQSLSEARTFIRDPVDNTPVSIALMRLPGLELAIAEDAVLLWSSKAVESQVRYDGEWHYHKLLDMVGDMYCCPQPLLAEIIAFRPGHTLSGLLRRSIFENAERAEA